MKRLTTLSLLFGLAGGCAENTSEGPGTPKVDTQAPTIEIQEPARGYITEASTVMLRGRVTDDSGVVKGVTVNGVDVTVSADGSFQQEITLENGISHLDTAARDGSGNVARDLRGVLSGNYDNIGNTIEDALALRVNRSTTDLLALQAEDALSTLNINEAFDLQNALYEFGDTCVLNASIFLDNVTRSRTIVATEPMDGYLRVGVAMNDVIADGRIVHQEICGSVNTTDVTITADQAYIVGDLVFSEDATGRLAPQLVNVTTEFINMQVDSTWVVMIASWILEVESRMETALTNQVTTEVPPIVDNFMLELTQGKDFAVLGQSASLSIEPTAFDFDTNGGILRADAHFAIVGTNGEYFSTPAAIPATQMAVTTHSLQLSVADDLLNQFLMSAWIRGAMTREIPINDPENSVDGQLSAVSLRPKLPPIVRAQADGTLLIEVGDLIIDLVDNKGSVLTSLASFANLELLATPGPNGGLMFRGVDSDYKFQVISTTGDEDIAEAYGHLVGSQLESLLTDLFGEINLPTFNNTTPVSPSVIGGEGYVGITAGLQYTP